MASLRDLLGQPPAKAGYGISHRNVAGTSAAAITAVIDMEDAGPCYQGALGELRGTLGAQSQAASGPPGGIYATDLFTSARGQATVFISCRGPVRPVGGVEAAVDGPIREYYVSGRHDTADEAAWRTEIGWPIFQTRPAPGAGLPAVTARRALSSPPEPSRSRQDAG